MKKTYLVPTVKEYNINLEQICAASANVDNTDTDGEGDAKYDMGFDWEE